MSFAPTSSINEIKAYLNHIGYECLTERYPTPDKRIKVKCSRGHVYNPKWYYIKYGFRCRKCERYSRKIGIEKVRGYAESLNLILLSKVYKNARTKLKFECSRGHIIEKHWDLLRRGHGCQECRFIDQHGDGNPCWRGGVSFEKYCEIWKDTEYKDFIKERDGYKCLNPYCNRRYLNYLNIHHIDYDKKNCHPNNLITVCVSCNSLANVDRKWHKAWYQAIMSKRYNYEFDPRKAKI